MVEGVTPKVCLSSLDLIAPGQRSERVSKSSRTASPACGEL